MRERSILEGLHYGGLVSDIRTISKQYRRVKETFTAQVVEASCVALVVALQLPVIISQKSRIWASILLTLNILII
jgi:PIN domain nuclease of toxin-antitoxin system